MPHQLEALEFINQPKTPSLRSPYSLRGCAGVFMEPGTGKTYVGLFSAQLPVLIICRRDDFLTWRNHLLSLGYSLHTDVCELSNGRAGGEGWFTLVTYDLVKNPRINAYIRRTPFQTVIADESHSIKRWSSARTKAVIRATRHIPRRLGMTGSPITNNLKDVFSQVLFVDDGATFGKSEWKFLNKYYLREGHGWYLRRTSKDLIRALLARISFAVKADDVLPDLPPESSILKAVPLSGAQRRQYEKVVKDWEIELSSGLPLEINQATVRLEKLKQIASGFYYDETGTPHYLRNHKLPLLLELLTDEDYLASKSKIVIWASHRAEIEDIALNLATKNIHYVTYDGSIPPKEREHRRVLFRDDPQMRCFVAQVDSGVGMNELVVADTAIYYSNSFKVVSRLQSKARIRRRGSEIHSAITYYDLVTEGTVDLSVLKGIKQRIDLASYVTEALRRGHPLRKALSFTA